MKRTGLIGVVLLLCLSLSTTGCLCGGFARPCGPMFGCAAPAAVGVVDYVDGANGGDCGTCAPAPVVGYGYPACGYPSGTCLATIGSGIISVGEGAVCLAASPFILVGKLICGGACGYERYPTCGCSSESYYGDNCYQAHDFSDPCCGNGYATGSTGCARCSGGFTEGIQPENAPVVNPVAKPQPTRISQTSYRAMPHQMPPQRLAAPPRPMILR